MKSIKLLTLLIALSLSLSQKAMAHEGHNDAFQESSVDTNKVKKVVLSPEGEKAIGLKIETVKESFLNKYIQVTGEVSVTDNQHYDISLSIAGLVKQVLVQEGDSVKQGQLLAVIQSVEATRLLKDLLSKKRQLEKEILILNKEFEVNKLTYIREKTLMQEGISPKKDFLQAENIYQASNASLLASRKELDFTVASTKSELDIMGISKQITEAALSSGVINPNINIFAPIEGVITMRNINPGEAIQVADKIFSIDNLKPIWINVDVYQEQIPYIKIGQEVKIISSSGEEVEGKISTKASLIKKDTRTLSVRIVSDNANESLKPGMTVNAKILYDKSENKSIVVPVSAIIEKQGESIAYVKYDDYYQAVKLKLGFKDASEVEVLQGLYEGDLLVVQGAEQLYSEALLKSSAVDEHHHEEGGKTNISFFFCLILSVLITAALTSLIWSIVLKSRSNK